MFDWLEATALAKSVAGSATATAWLSAIHAIGFTVLTGSALVANLRGIGAVFPQRAIAEVLTPASRGILVGLAISASTGLLLFAARATEVAANGTFRLKMTLLVAAVAFQFGVIGVNGTRHVGSSRARFASAIGISLWLALALAACAFILLE